MTDTPRRSRFSRDAMIANAQRADIERTAQSAHQEVKQALATQAPGEGATNFRGEITAVRFTNPENGFLIATVRAQSPEVPADLPPAWRTRWNPNQVAIKGSAPSLASASSTGAIVECGGRWAMDPKFGLQYNFEWAREVMPTSLEALRAYLAAGRLKGVGPSLGKQIVDKWGDSTLDMLDKNPEQLASIKGVSPEKAQLIGEAWKTKRALYELTAFFGLYGIGEVWVPRIQEAFKDAASEPGQIEAMVRRNPFLLTRVEGIGFATADKMAMAMGVHPTAPERVEALLLHILGEFSTGQGHTACPIDEWFRMAREQLRLDNATIAPIAQGLINRREVIMRKLPVSMADLLGRAEDDDVVPLDQRPPLDCVSLKKDAACEHFIASDIVRLSQDIAPLHEAQIMARNRLLGERADVLDASQLEAANGVLDSAISVLTGGPGTGKTTTLKTILDIAEEAGMVCRLMAPTGRAAKRMKEATGRPAATVHRTLEFAPKEGFKRNRNNPLEGDVFVIDESSMLDNALAASFLRAVPDGARVLFVGDIDQLPSVGAGSFLKDIIDSGKAPTFRLTRVHRQAAGSKIAEAAQRVLAGRMPDVGGDPYQDDFAWINAPMGLSSEQTNSFIAEKVAELAKGFVERGVPRGDIQILSPQREGLVGVSGLNQILRPILNEEGRMPVLDDNEIYGLGDRLLVTKNNYDKMIFNGDMGTVKEVRKGGVVMTPEGTEGNDVELDAMESKQLQLGYAITVHKSQGGERPVIIMTCSPSHTFSMNKNLVYTGITRGKSHVVIVGSPKTLMSVLRKREKTYRLTGLVSEIHRQSASPKAKAGAKAKP